MEEAGNLVLTRKVGERVRVTYSGEEMLITVSAIQCGQVRMSFIAPKSIQIDREEIAIRKLQEKKNENI